MKIVQLIVDNIPLELIEKLNKQGDSALIKSIRQGNIDELKEIYKKIENSFEKGLMSFEKFKQICNLKNNSGFSALHEAVIWSKLEILTFLIEQKVNKQTVFDPKLKDHNGNTLLHLCFQRKFCVQSNFKIDKNVQIKIFEIIFSFGLNLNEINNDGFAAIHCSDISNEFFQMLLENGCDILILNSFNKNALICQIELGLAYNVESLLKFMKNKNMIEMINFQGIDKALDKNLNSILHLLFSIDSIECVEFIFERDIKQLSNLFEYKNNKGETPLIVALNQLSIHCINFFINKIKNRNNHDIIEIIKNFRDFQGDSLLHISASFNNTHLINSLIDICKFDPNIKNEIMDEFTDGGTPIHIAAMKGSLDSLKILLNSKAEINNQNNPNMDTPIHLSIRFKQYETTKVLLEMGADTSIFNRQKMTPIDEVEMIDEESIILLFFKENRE